MKHLKLKIYSISLFLLFITSSCSQASSEIFTISDDITFRMIYVKGGNFNMGCTNEQSSDCFEDEIPAHNVILSDYYIGEIEVTQGLWYSVMGTTIEQQGAKMLEEYNVKAEAPLYGAESSNPMYYINYLECQEFCNQLNNLLKDKLPTGYKFTIPTEAQWEYAARGGNKSKHTKYSGSDNLYEVAWNMDNSGFITRTCGLKSPNELGIYDMSGNLFEWCLDYYDESYYNTSSATIKDPKNLIESSTQTRVMRGGSWGAGGGLCRISYRNSHTIPEDRNPFLGFRLVLCKQ
ncbi:MAG: formylglycine-generating enzyme family protein [bacterium]